MKDYSSNSRPFTDKILVIATFNENKYLEIVKALGPLKIRTLSLKDFSGEIPESPETGKNFAENAQQKAEFYSKFLDGRPVLAEDSGLVIPSLNGFPGIHSARIAADDRERIDSVLKRLPTLPAQSGSRFAYYVCSMYFISGDHQTSAEARCEGTILEAPRGNSGFGYDPIFQPDGSEKTFGQMTLEEKSHYSHRAKAAAKISPAILKEFS
jgi:XTP/dITP diphosphohydrolase